MNIEYRESSPEITAILAAAGIHPVLARLVCARGTKDPIWVQPDLPQLLKPESLKGIHDAAIILADALHAEARICIVADYDCDGATACAVAILGLRRLAQAMGVSSSGIFYVVPNRLEMGYGLTPEVVQLAARHSPLGPPDLLVTVDNGIASVEGVAYAQSLGIEVLITDHHLPADETPEAAAIVNPNQRGCTFPSKHLAGVGVIFYVISALRAHLRQQGDLDAGKLPRLDDLLDLVALGTVADVVRLDDNNRLLVAQGLKRIRSGKLQVGLSALFTVAGKTPQSASTEDLGFAIGPRLNAAGRLADMALGISCLLETDPQKAIVKAQKLEQLNQERRALEATTRAQALQALPRTDTSRSATICVFDPQWHPGIIGIVASRLKDEHHRPCIVFALDGENALRGSGRSILGLHLRDCIDRVAKRHPEVILRFGGHAMAAGLTILKDELDLFQDAFDHAAQEMLEPGALNRSLVTDGSLAAADCTLETALMLQAHTWGQGYPAPLFIDPFEVQHQRWLKDKHLQLRLRREGRAFDAIWFNAPQGFDETEAAFAYRLSADAWQGKHQLKLHIMEAL